MMKKTYITPEMEKLDIENMTLLAGSVTGDNGIGYGGVDEEGEYDPE